MKCEYCSNLLPAPQGKFCPFCGAETAQQSEAPATAQDAQTAQSQGAGDQALNNQSQAVSAGSQFDTTAMPVPPMQQPMQQAAFQPHFQQPEKKSTPTWVIVLIVAAIVFFLALCCGGSVLFLNNLDDSPPVTTGITTTEDATTTDTSAHSGVPSDEEILALLEDKYGISFRIEWSNRDSSFPSLELRPVNQADMDFFFTVELADLDGNFFSLDEIGDGFLLALAGSRAERSIMSLSEETFGSGNVDRLSVFYSLEHSWLESLPQSVHWNPDDGMDALRQAIADEMADGLRLSIMITLDESQNLDDISWEQVEELAEKITTSGYYGISNSLSVSVGWEIDSKRVEWRAQNGEVFSLERRDW